MQRATENNITQGIHGPYNAVDFSASPDIDYYAPETGKITSVGDSGTCGLRIELIGPTGRHGFCHNEKSYVKVGDAVKRGQKLGKMGYTGYTEPSGPAGRHLHWVIAQGNNYVYPLSLVNEPFIKLEENDMPTRSEVDTFFLEYHHRHPTEAELVKYTSNRWVTLAKSVLLAQKKEYEAKLAVEAKVLAPGKYLVK